MCWNKMTKITGVKRFIYLFTLVNYKSSSITNQKTEKVNVSTQKSILSELCKYLSRQKCLLIYNMISRSAHRTHNFTNPEYFVCLLLEYFFQVSILNQYQNTPKNVNITRYIKRKNALQHLKLVKLKFRIRIIGCLMS